MLLLETFFRPDFFWIYFQIYFCTILVSCLVSKSLTYRGFLIFSTGVLALCVCFLLFNFTFFALDKKSVLFDLTANLYLYEHFNFNLQFMLDFLSFFFLLLVFVIGLTANFYTYNYLKYDNKKILFSLLLNSFIFSMGFLVLANNLFTLFLGWELIGFTSFFLINFWNTKRRTLKASFKAFCFNKVSDVFLLAFIILLYIILEQDVISVINLTAKRDLLTENPNSMYLGLFLIVASSIKSAQFVFHLWLPDSMEAPVPASALIHSATLVSAGVYLLLRFHLIIDVLQYQTILFWIGSITAAYGGVVASVQTDLKRLLAYSTISHCGFLFVCTGSGYLYLTIIYLYLHGIFKASTFYCVGSFFRLSNSQDMRQMGIFNKVSPSETAMLILTSMNLGGLPLTFGYLYKSEFLKVLILLNVNYLLLILCFIGMASSLVYIYRLIFFTSFSLNNFTNFKQFKVLQNNENNYRNYNTSNWVQFFAVFILYLFVLFCCFFFISHWLAKKNLILLDFNLFYTNLPATVNQEEYANILIIFFYTLYLTVFFCILFFNWNYLYNFNVKFYIILNVTIVIVLSLIFFFWVLI